MNNEPRGMAAPRRCSAPSLREWGRRCLMAMDVPDADAACVADSLVQTSLWGVDSHGIARLPHYLNRLAHGSILARPDVRIVRSGPATAQVHGGQGLGIVVAHRANRLAMDIARESGVAAVGVSDSSHCGAVGLYSRAAADAGLVGLAFTHSDSIAAPFGGHVPFLGTNPVSVAVPRQDGPPVCLDMASTAIAWNRVMNGRREGHALPPDVALDDAGHDAIDPHAVRALRPLGGPRYGYKGYGLALMIELLCGPLNGNPYGPHISPMYQQLDVARRLGAFFIVIDPGRFAGGPLLGAAVAQMAGELAAQPGQPRMPGDPEQAAQAQRVQDGIPMEAGLWQEVLLWSERLRTPPPGFA
ncbi:MAG TPA: Ldh family oxidoreductase [Bordetella sp.]|nr:Ldh family oxidoreductase [Bordetella sp.]